MGKLAWAVPEEPVPDPHFAPYSHWWKLTSGGERQPAYLELACAHGQDVTVRCSKHRPEPPPAARAAAADAIARLDRRLVATDLPDDVLNPKIGERRWKSPDPHDLPPDDAVIVAVIDDAVGFANERFRKLGGVRTRFDYVWLQGAWREEGQQDDLPLGREYDRYGIETLFRDHTRAGVVDEHALYHAAGLIDFRRAEVQSAAARASHGTGVLDRAGGRSPWRNQEGPVLMAVSLPSQITQDTTGVFLDNLVIPAIDRILSRVQWLREEARKVRGKLPDYPVVINLSYALTAGPMDGSTPIDQVVAERGKKPRDECPDFHVVVPAGNHRLSQTHARLICGDNGWSEKLAWRVLPDDRTPSFVEIWSQAAVAGPPAKPAIVVELVPPGHETLDQQAPPMTPEFGQFVEFRRPGENRPLARAYYFRQELTGRQQIVLAVLPTVADAPGQAFGPAGDWTIRIHGDPKAAADLRVQRDDTPLGYRLRGRQSYFHHPDYDVYDGAGRPLEEDARSAPVTREGTLNAIVGRRPTQVIGAYSKLEWKEMWYSGIGPVEVRPGPDALHVADASRLHRGVKVSGTVSGSSAMQTGTSFAAPAHTRWMASAARRAPVGPPQGAPLFPDDDEGPERVMP